MGSGKTNWTQEETQKELTERAQKVLKKVKKQRKDKEFALIRVCDGDGNPIKPATYKEVERKQ